MSREATGFRCDSTGMHIWLLVLSGHRGRRARRCRDSPAGARPAFPGCSPAVGKRPERPGRRWSRTRHTTGKTRAERSIPPRITWPWMDVCRQVPAPSGETCQTPRDSMWVPSAAEKPVRVSYQLLAHRCAVWMLQDDAVPDTRDSHRSLLDVDRLVPWIGRRPLVLYCRLSIFCSGPLRHIRDFQRRRPCHVN